MKKLMCVVLVVVMMLSLVACGKKLSGTYEAEFDIKIMKYTASYAFSGSKVEITKQHMHLIENAKKAAENIGLTPKVMPIRGGTDGSYLSFQGLPCPNLGTGGYAFHGPYEHITVEGMDKATDMIMEIIKLYAEQ